MNLSFKSLNPWKYGSYKPRKLFNRNAFDIIQGNLDNEYIIGIIGSRQVGKSSLIYMLIDNLISKNIDGDYIYYLNLDDFSLHEPLSSVDNFLSFFKPDDDNKKYIFIDEIQRLNNAGLILKAIYDMQLNIKLIYLGSSQLEIKSKVKEHLVGRVRSFEIQRVNFNESKAAIKDITDKNLLKLHLIYGGYPKVIKESDINEKRLILRDIYNSYVQKDIIEFLNIDDPIIFNKLLTVLAGQIGNLLNVENISKSLKIPRDKVNRYLNILESTFIIKLVYPFHKNYNKEIVKTPKIYFLDLGLRNHILNNFLDIELRQDKGELFENFYFLELLSNDIYGMNKINYWRTTNQTEIDFIVHSDKGLEAIETKYSSASRPRSFSTFTEHYPEAQCRLITSSDIS